MGFISLGKKILFVLIFVSALGYAAKYIGDYNELANNAKTALTGYTVKNVIIPVADKIFEKAHSLADQSAQTALAEIKSANSAFAPKKQFIARKSNFNNHPNADSSAQQNQETNSNLKTNNPENSFEQCCACN